MAKILASTIPQICSRCKTKIPSWSGKFIKTKQGFIVCERCSKVIPLHTKITRSISKKKIVFNKPAKKPVIKPFC